MRNWNRASGKIFRPIRHFDGRFFSPVFAIIRLFCQFFPPFENLTHDVARNDTATKNLLRLIVDVRNLNIIMIGGSD